jgi:hypothetical protein
MLAALSPQHLTHLRIDQYRCSAAADAADALALAAAISQFTSLQQLTLNNWSSNTNSSCLASIAQFSCLTWLKLCGNWDHAQQPLQQALAQPLPLRELILFLGLDRQELDMSALTQLQRLHMSGLPEQLVLPRQLLRLQARTGAGGLAAALPLQQLQDVDLSIVFDTPQPLPQLAQLPALRHVALSYSKVRHAARTAAAWPYLQQLQQLDVNFDVTAGDVPNEQQMDAILARVAASTSLTKLGLGAACWDDEEEADHEVVADENFHLDPQRQWCCVAACASLSGLTRLRDLTLYQATYLDAGDASLLTTHTGLTSLVLESVGGVEEAQITAIARSLQQLQVLDLSFHELESATDRAAAGGQQEDDRAGFDAAVGAGALEGARP